MSYIEATDKRDLMVAKSYGYILFSSGGLVFFLYADNIKPARLIVSHSTLNLINLSLL